VNNLKMIFNELIKKIKKMLTGSSYGLTLIELMVVVSILALVTLGLVTLFSGGVHSYISGDAQLEAQRNARQAMDRMARELRHGRKVTSFDPNSPNSITVQIPTIDGTAGYSVAYSWSGTEHDPVVRTVTGGSNPGSNPLINDVLNLEFDNSKSSRINIKLEVDVDRDRNADISLDTAVNLRNFL
jgi:prepilin-type N-terminal cleavage/methylation domain-containing protein